MDVNLHKEYEIKSKMGICVDMYAHLVLEYIYTHVVRKEPWKILKLLTSSTSQTEQERTSWG